MKRYNKLLLLVIIIVGVLIYAIASGKFSLSFFNTDENVPKTAIMKENQKANEQPDSEEPSATEGAANTEDAANTEGTANTENSQGQNAVSEDVTASKATPTPTAISPTSNTELPVYTVDANSGEIKAVTAMVPAGDKLNPEVIVDNVIESLADQSIVVEVKDVTTNGDTIIVNFDKEATPFNNLGSGYESAILDAIAQSLIDNLDKYNNIIYRIDDGPYLSGVYEYGVDEVYFSR